MSDEPPEDQPSNVLVFRNAAGQPVPVPEDVVIDAERPYRAYMAHMGGKDWATIAKEEGYPSAGAAAADIQRYTAEARSLVTVQSQQDMLQRNVARLDFMLSRLWPGVEAGLVTAIKEARGLVMDQTKTIVAMAGMPGGEEESDASRTVVIYGERSSEEDYIEQLKRAASDDTPGPITQQPQEPASRATVIREPPDTKE